MACGGDTEGSSAISVRLEAPSEVEVGDFVPLRLIVKNESLFDVQLGSGFPEDRYVFKVSDSEGNEVWNSQFNKPHEDILIEWTVAPKEEIVYEEDWHTVSNNGGLVHPGDYFVSGKLLLLGDDLESSTEKLTVLP
jgi:hypothetical protein